MLKLVPAAVQQHLKVPAAALVSALTRPCRTASPAQAAPVAAAAWQGMNSRSSLGLAPAATYSSGAGSSDAIPPSNLPSGALSSEASAADDDTIDRMPEESFPAGTTRTPGPSETMSADAARRSPDFPHGDQATEEGRTAAADPYGPNDASSKVDLPKDPLPEPLYQPKDLTSTAEPQPVHPRLPPKEPEGTHLSS